MELVSLFHDVRPPSLSELWRDLRGWSCEERMEKLWHDLFQLVRGVLVPLHEVLRRDFLGQMGLHDFRPPSELWRDLRDLLGRREK